MTLDTGFDVHREPHPRVDVLGVHISVTSLEETVRQIGDWINSGTRRHVCVCDVNSLLNAAADDDLVRFYNESGLTLPDGMPLVWAGHAAQFPHARRVCGPDLMPAVFAASVEAGWKHYLLGGAEGVAERLAAMMRSRHEGIQIVGVSCPPFRPLSPAETSALLDDINESGADIVWIGLGAPKQERWMAAHRERLNASVLIGVGAAFNFEVGDVRRAPLWMQRSGLEWAYRFSQEPQRLWRRYLVGVPLFCMKVIRRRPRPVAPSAPASCL